MARSHPKPAVGDSETSRYTVNLVLVRARVWTYLAAMNSPLIVAGGERHLVGECPLCGQPGINVYKRLTMIGVLPEYFVLTDVHCPVDGLISPEAAAREGGEDTLRT